MEQLKLGGAVELDSGARPMTMITIQDEKPHANGKIKRRKVMSFA